MEVVLLVLGITGIALLAMTRVIQRRSSGARPASRGNRVPVAAKRGRTVAAAATPAETWKPNPLADESGWDDDLGWEGVEAPKPPAWEQWREREPEATPVQEAPPAESWQDEEDWLDEDDGFGWEGAGVGGNGNGNGHADPSPWTSGREWTTRESGPSPEPAVAGASASAATDVAAEPRTYALDDNEWDEEPAERPWGAPTPQPAPVPEERRKLHPVLLLAIYAAAGIGLVVLASTALLGGSDPAPSKPTTPRSTPAPVRTPEPTPEATGSVADDPEALEEARAAEAKARAAEARERRQFRRARSGAVAARNDAVAAARRKARAARENRGGRSNGGAPAPTPVPTPAPSGGGTGGSGAGGSGGGGGGGGGSGGGGWRWRRRRRWRRQRL